VIGTDSAQCPQCGSVEFRYQEGDLGDCFRVVCLGCREAGPWGLIKPHAVTLWRRCGRRGEKVGQSVVLIS
jgi:hypothetical protein